MIQIPFDKLRKGFKADAGHKQQTDHQTADDHYAAKSLSAQTLEPITKKSAQNAAAPVHTLRGCYCQIIALQNVVCNGHRLSVFDSIRNLAQYVDQCGGKENGDQRYSRTSGYGRAFPAGNGQNTHKQKYRREPQSYHACGGIEHPVEHRAQRVIRRKIQIQSKKNRQSNKHHSQNFALNALLKGSFFQCSLFFLLLLCGGFPGSRFCFGGRSFFSGGLFCRSFFCWANEDSFPGRGALLLYMAQ